MMKKRIILLLTLSLCALLGIEAQTLTDNEWRNRAFNEYDVTAYCSYTSFHPQHYILDNSWDILRFFRTPGTLHALKCAGIAANNSQLRLLEVGGLLERRKENDSIVFHTLMPIFSKEQTGEIRLLSLVMADSLLTAYKADFKALLKLIKRKGWEKQTYSLVYSVLLDGYIWDDTRIVKASDMNNHGTWSGVYYAMYDKRPGMKCGTNGYGPIKLNWSDSLCYWVSTKKMLQVANEINSTRKPVITDRELAQWFSPWGICDAEGQITVPVIYKGSGDEMDRLCCQIADKLSAAVKAKAEEFMKRYDIGSRNEAEVILYHEILFDMKVLLEERGLIKMPAILKGEEVGQSHFGDVVFIML